jgi:hypothetical protein
MSLLGPGDVFPSITLRQSGRESFTIPDIFDHASMDEHLWSRSLSVPAAVSRSAPGDVPEPFVVDPGSKAGSGEELEPAQGAWSPCLGESQTDRPARRPWHHLRSQPRVRQPTAASR